MNTADVTLGILQKAGAIFLHDHFVYTSGKHGSTYVNKDAIYPHTFLANDIGKLFAQKYKDTNIDVIVAPALGGIILSQWTAYNLSLLTGREILGIYTEKTPEHDQIFTRGYDLLVSSKNVLVIEDITTTGVSVRKVIATVKKAGGTVISACAMVNKNIHEVTTESIGVPFEYLTTFGTTLYEPNECPLCKKQIPINTKLGHGKKYSA